jgi:hypothetical protein
MGGKVAVVDIDCSVRPEQAKDENFADWLFEGDAAEVCCTVGKPRKPPRSYCQA